MAQVTKSFIGDIVDFVEQMDQAILEGSASASLEAAEETMIGACRVFVRVYERYSYAGGNRLSLSVTVAGDGFSNWVSATTSGGSQALFFKVNTWGEETFMEKFEEFFYQYTKS